VWLRITEESQEENRTTGNKTSTVEVLTFIVNDKHDFLQTIALP
jgi:hypothetical protein